MATGVLLPRHQACVPSSFGENAFGYPNYKGGLK